MALLDALRDSRLDASAARALLDRAGGDIPREAWRGLLRDEAIPRVVRRVIIRRLLETAAPDATLAELGTAIEAASWLSPTDIRNVSVVAGKLPVQFLAEDRVIVLDICPAIPGDGDSHRLRVYLRLAGQPELEEILAALHGSSTSGADIPVREIGFAETETPNPDTTRPARRVPVLGSLVLCRRVLCDTRTGLHTLVDVIAELPVPVPGPAMFDIFLQLREVAGPTTVTIDVFGPGTTDEGVLLTTGTLRLAPAADPPPGPPPHVLGVAIPNVAVGFERAGEHRMRVRCGDDLLGEHRFDVVEPTEG
jgi:hypothetical protein